jgi:uncharacterized membrane protein (DUF485 family)
MSERDLDTSEAGSDENALSETAMAERLARQRKRSIAIGLSLLFLAVLFYLVTLVKFGSAVTEKAGS